MSPVIAVDANIIISALLGRSGPLMAAIGAQRLLATTERVYDEVIGVLGDRAGRDDWLGSRAEALFAGLHIAVNPAYAAHLGIAAAMLGNPDHRDAHLLAFAWMADADLWTHDRDFFGTGWPSWTTANLKLELGLSE